MNKVIIFLIFVIIASAFASDVQRDCALEAALKCEGNSMCIGSVTNECLERSKTVVPPTPSDENVVKSNYKNCTRICSTDTNCNCRTLSKTKCSIYSGSTRDACMTESYSQCQSRCIQSRRCYRLDCRKAGVRRCNKQSRLTCALRHANSETLRTQCQQTESACCQRYELATCKKARRDFLNKDSCGNEAQEKCSSLYGKDRCRCVSSTRKSCIARKESSYKNNVRKFFDCEQASKVLCSEKKCGTEYDQCVATERANCEPICHRDARIACKNVRSGPCYDEKIKKCSSKFRKTYCKKTSRLVCESDSECRTVESNTCKKNQPECLKNLALCDDKNKCTNDICHPTKGCVHTTVNCDDNNACTTETCDPLLGCVYKHKVCADALFCTTDSCDTQTGECKNTFDNSVHHCKCKGGPCKVDNDCVVWGTSQDLDNKCQKAVCNLDLGSCVAVKKENCATQCQTTCIASSLCDEAKCVLNTATKNYDCIHTNKKCNDHKNCTTDSCDPKVGCVFKFTPSTECPSNPICENDAGCVQWGITQKFHESCQKAYCNVPKGVCESTPSTKNCKLNKCKETCKAAHQCETAECVQDGENAYCVRNPIICDDKKTCTKDSCNPATGCEFKYTVTEKCKPGYQCEKDNDCKYLIISENLTKKCQTSVCDTTQGTCAIVPIDKDCKNRITDCKEDCKPFNACEEATCVVSKDTFELVCRRRTNKCDDSKECTVDTCDEIKGCKHTYRVSEKCPENAECENDNDCFKYAFLNKLSRQCRRAVCDKARGSCKSVPKTRKCTTKTECESNCKITNTCETSAACKLNDDGDYECQRVQKSCDDSNGCTHDFCDVTSGNCVNKFIPNANCKTKCTYESDCAEWAKSAKLSEKCLVPACDNARGGCISQPDPSPKCARFHECQLTCKPKDSCHEAVCAPTEGDSFICRHTKKSCDDNQKCTTDSCDATKGCENKYTISKECPENAHCKVTQDCIAWGIKQQIAGKCLDAVCDVAYGRCITQPTKDANCVVTSDCDKTCKPANGCESAVCQKVNGAVTCVRTQNTCDDKKECTVDSCDVKTGKCNNVYTSSPKCPTEGNCEKNLDCQKWFKSQDFDQTCLTPVCDAQLGACKVITNGKRCSSGHCKKNCVARNACEEPVCSYDVNKRMVCEYKRKSCDDSNKCTVDSCDNVKGCVFTHDKTIKGCENPVCKDKVDCEQWGVTQQLESKCQEAVCDVATHTCKSVLINTDKCNPQLEVCKKECKPSNACETAVCQVEPNTKAVSCQRTPISCDDGNDCTKDVCDNIQGCKFTYEVSEKCSRYCKLDVDCAEWSISKKLSASCQIAKCDEKRTSCVAVKDENNKGCEDITEKCKLQCKPEHACDTVRCDRKSPTSNEISCIHTPKSCDDSLDCTADSCDKVTGCKNEFKKSEKCTTQCAKDLDCKSWGETEKLADKCELAFCNLVSGSCDRKVGPQTEKCKESNLCETANDCATSRFGSTCCVYSGRRKCCQHKCRTDSDCVPRNEKEWGYCRKQTTGQFDCEYKPKCVGNEDCDDKDACTRDICMKDYGFCKNQKRCVDHTECTEDICIPGKDGKTFECKNPAKTCTTDKTLLDKNFALLTKEQQTKWLGQCSHVEGCVSCVVHAQCNDNKGCTADSCENQQCVHRPIHNEWCDPKLEGQAITVQAITKFIRPEIRA